MDRGRALLRRLVSAREVVGATQTSRTCRIGPRPRLDRNIRRGSDPQRAECTSALLSSRSECDKMRGPSEASAIGAQIGP
eukprot:4695943-Pyramimonas_sp.AAC.1